MPSRGILETCLSRSRGWVAKIWSRLELVRLANCTSKGWKTSSHESSDDTKTLRTNLGRTPQEPNERRGNVKCASRLRMWLNAFQICWYYPGPDRPMIGLLVLAVILLLASSLFYVESVRGSVFVVKFLSALRSLRFLVRVMTKQLEKDARKRDRS